MLFESLFVVTLALGVSAQSSTSPVATTTGSSGSSVAGAQTTINAFAGSGVVGSIVSADACQTVLALQCDSDDNIYCASASSYGVTELTYTQKASALNIDYTISTQGLTGALSISCDLKGTSPTWTEGVCTYSISGSMAGQHTSTHITTAISTAISEEPLAITAGAEKLPTGSATCSVTTGSGAAPTAVSEIYKVLVPVGAAVVAGAGAFF